MRIRIEQVTGGLLPQAVGKRCVTFATEELPTDTSKRVKSLMSTKRIRDYASESAHVAGADHRQIKIEFRDRRVVERYLIEESVCEPEFLDLLDELFIEY